MACDKLNCRTDNVDRPPDSVRLNDTEHVFLVHMHCAQTLRMNSSDTIKGIGAEIKVCA